MSAGSGLIYQLMSVGEWRVPAVTFAEPARDALTVSVRGTVINSIPGPPPATTAQRDWKRRIASIVKAARGNYPWDATCEYAISVALRFQWPSRSHGSQPLDVENFVKPVLDAAAAGLFCPTTVDPDSIVRWDYDDSNFRTLLVHRLPDATEAGDEGVALLVSCR